MKRIVSLTLMGLLLAVTQLAAQVPARKADELVNSIGVNVHFSFGESPYHQHYDSARNLLGESGIRFIRDRIDPSASRRERQQMDWWDLYGVQIAGIVDAKENVGNGQYPTLEEVPELLRIAREAYGPQRIAGLMGLNEWDISRDTTSTGEVKKKTRSQWVPEWRLQQRTLYDAVKSDPVLSAVPVVMSPLAHSFNIEFLERTEGDPQPLGNVSDMVDIGNDHPYPSSIGLPNEERSGPVPISIDNIVGRVRQVAGADVPVWFSETGYSQSDDGTVAPGTTVSQIVSGSAVAKYTPRLLAQHFKNPDVRKTFLYELLSTNDRTAWGLVREDFNKTPAFYAVKNFITLCEEATWDTATKEWITPPDYTPQSLDYTLAGDLTNVEQLLLQKSDGTYLLLLWQEVASFDAVARKDIAHPLRNIQVSLNDQVAPLINVYRLYRETNPSAALTPLATYSQTSQLTVGVPDDIVALEIKPAPDAPPRPAPDSAVASYATLSPVVDGHLTEYDLSTTFTRTVVGSSDNQVRFASQWDKDYLYVGVQVVDADLQNDSPESWYDDNVELFLDPTFNRGTTYDSLDRQLLLGWGDSTLSILPQALAGVQYAQANLVDGYSMEMAIPWTQLGGGATAGHVLGFDVGVNDDDDGAEREAQLMWVGSGENFRNPSGFGRLVLAKPDTVHYTSAQRDIPSRMGSGNWFKGQIPDGYLDANQRSGAECFRSSLFEQDYWNGAPVLQLDSQLVFAYQNGLQPPVVQFSVREGRPYPTTYQDWYAIGQQYAERYSPNSDWFVSQGIADYGVVWWGLGNEPDRGVRATPDSLDAVSPAVYAEMYRGYAEGIKSVDPKALVLVHGIRATGWDNPWLEAVAPLLNDGTLDALDIHKYGGTAQIKSGTWSMQYRFDLLKEQTGVTREDVLFTCTEFNTKEQQSNEDDAARGFLFTVWDAWGVVDGNGNPNTVFAFPWTIYFSSDTTGTVAASNTPRWAMAEQLDPWTPNKRGQTLQLVTELADGTSVVYSDPYEAGELKLTGENKTIWVWNNWENATNSYGRSYTVRDIPADATTLEVWGYDGPWNGVRQTINVSGENSYTVDSLDQDQTYMFVLRSVPANNGDSTVATGRVRIRAKGSQGSEQMSLLIDGQVVQSWTVATAPDNYLYEGYAGGALSVRFDNDTVEGGDRNLGINYVEVCGVKHEPEVASSSLSTSCQGNDGVFIWLYCNGPLDFGEVGCSASAHTGSEVSKAGVTGAAGWFSSYPNPAREQLSVEGSADYGVVLYDLTGRKVLQHDHLRGKAQLDIAHLRPGVYVMKVRDGQHPPLQQRVVVE